MIKNALKILVYMIFIGTFLYANSVQDDKTITITKQTFNIPSIQVVSADSSDLGMKIYKMLVQDLRIVGNFNVYYDDSLSGDLLSNKLAMQEYKDKGINFLAQISYKKQWGKLVGYLSLYDFTQDRRTDIDFTQDEEQKYPFIAHAFTSYLSKYIKAEDISWINRYVVFSGYVGGAKSDIVISDYTYTYKKSVIINDGLNLFPKWADPNQESFYYTQVDDVATIYKYNLESNKSEKITASQGMAVVSDVSKDGTKLLVSLSPNGLSDIYLYDTKNKKFTQLTKYSGIDVNAHFSNNEKSFVFVSDRLGYPNVFMQDLKPDANVMQLVYQGRNNSSLSTFGQYVVYSSRESDEETGVNVFNLYMISTQSDYVRRLSRKGMNKIPQFSGDGDCVMFLRQDRKENAIGIIRLSANKTFLFPLKKIKIQAFDW